MDDARKAELNAAGVDVDSALERFMGNEKMLEKYLGRFPTDKNYTALVEAIQNDDKDGAKIAIHTLKGVCGTIGCKEMFAQVIEQEAAMRSGDWEKAVAMMPQVAATYEKICKTLAN